MRTITRRLGTAFASVATAAALIAVPVTAQAQDLSSQVGIDQQQVRDGAWNTRNQLHQQAGNLPAGSSDALTGVVDGAVNAAFPGLIQERTAPRPAPAAPAAAPAPAPRATFDYGPCPRDAKVCVDIDGNRTWLQNANGKYYGPAYHAPGKPGQETPRGTFHVTRKVKDEVSYLFDMAPMPYAVYFTNNGHAFHQGNTYYESAGCIRLAKQDAIKYFNDLQVGDKVFIY